jgi:1,4-dihydroxy-2-naphthoate octaprenyltransferase
MKTWIGAMRLRTLPLSIAGIITGGVMAYKDSYDTIDHRIFIHAIITALLLQILSNFANDYGDFKKGTDNDNRKGPQRAVQSGEITAKAMMRAIIVTALLALASGILLLFLAFRDIDFRFIIYFLIGVACIAAALKYTMGKNPYGYMGLGDIFVFVFFGMVSSCGTYFLLTNTFSWDILLPSISIGAWSTAVLNLNNLRDIDNDKASGKITIPVRLGMAKGLVYHYVLIALPFVCNLIYAILNANQLLIFVTLVSLGFAYVLFKPLFNNPDHETLDGLLKKTALFALLFTGLFVVGVMFN